MKLDDKVLRAVKRAVDGLDAQPRAIPAEVLMPLTEIARPGLRLRLDIAASDVVGTPVVSVGATPNTGFLDGLTPRQTEVATLIIDGLSNRQISDQLGISVATVKDHVHAVLDRLALSSRVALIAAARM